MVLVCDPPQIGSGYVLPVQCRYVSSMLVMDVDLADNSLLLFAAVVTVDLSRTYMCIYRVCTMQYENDPSLVPTCTVVYLSLYLLL